MFELSSTLPFAVVEKSSAEKRSHPCVNSTLSSPLDGIPGTVYTGASRISSYDTC